MIIEILAQITAPGTARRKGFTAGIVLRDNTVTEAADIIRFMRKWSRDRVRDYCRNRNWRAEIVERREIP